MSCIDIAHSHLAAVLEMQSYNNTNFNFLQHFAQPLSKSSLDQEADQRAWREGAQKDIQVRKLNGGDAMGRRRWRRQIKDDL